ncbi:MAG: hypothetical protein AAB554_02560 [Patescibacteria group bacterium]
MPFREPQPQMEPSPERPKKLFHATSNREIEEFHPRAKSIRDPEEGPMVFATPDMALATIFLAPGRFVRKSGTFNDVPYAVILDKEGFLKADKGGAIYELPPEGFGCRPEIGLGENEWTCPTSVKPIGKIDVPSALEAMLEAGVQVFFTDAATVRDIETDEDHGLRRLRAMRSENQERGVNVRELPLDDEA